MVSGTSKEAVQPALVLTWDASITRVLCPYRCRTKVHSHGTTIPCEDFINSRAAHCGPDDIRHDRQYRLVYPFEHDDATRAMSLWWELDWKHKRWRTLGWSVYDPAYENATELHGYSREEDGGIIKDHSSSNPEERTPYSSWDDGSVDQDLKELAQGVDSMVLNNDQTSDLEPQMDGTDEFLILCLTNRKESARAMLNGSSSLRRRVCARSAGRDKELLHMACEEGHLKIVDLLLEFGAVLEARDCEGNTPLLSAINHGRIDVVSRLIQTGANTRVMSENGEGFVEKARKIWEQLEFNRTYCRRTLDAPLEMPKLVPFEEREVHEVLDDEGKCVMTYIKDDTPFYIEIPTEKEREKAAERLHHTEGKIERLKDILREYEIEEAQLCSEALLKKVASNHGAEQADHVRTAGDFDMNMIISQIMVQTFQTPLDTPWKTVACMTRGLALPYTFAVSGWTRGLHGTADGALDRSRWIDKVFQLAEIVQHDLQVDDRDGNGMPGSYLACHSEKQVLAYFIYHHTSAYLELDDPDEILDSLRRLSFKEDGSKILKNCDAPSLKKLEVTIFVCQPNRDHSWICHDCIEFCRKVVYTFGMRLDLRAVKTVDGVPGNELVRSLA